MKGEGGWNGRFSALPRWRVVSTKAAGWLARGGRRRDRDMDVEVCGFSGLCCPGGGGCVPGLEGGCELWVPPVLTCHSTDELLKAGRKDARCASVKEKGDS